MARTRIRQRAFIKQKAYTICFICNADTSKALSYNNVNDTDAALRLVAEFDDPAIAIIKYANPCGVAVSGDPLSAWQNALAADPVSAFGGIVACNRPLDGQLAGDFLYFYRSGHRAQCR